MSNRETVLQLVANELEIEASRVSDGANLRDDLGATSPQLLELALALEEQLGISVPDSALARFHTVSDVIKYVERRRPK